MSTKESIERESESSSIIYFNKILLPAVELWDIKVNRDSDKIVDRSIQTLRVRSHVFFYFVYFYCYFLSECAKIHNGRKLLKEIPVQITIKSSTFHATDILFYYKLCCSSFKFDLLKKQLVKKDQ